MTEAEQIMKRCQAGTRNYEEANNLHAACYGMIGKLLEQRKLLTDEQIDEEFKLYASKFDTSSDKWLDMGADDYFKAGFKAAHGIKENT